MTVTFESSTLATPPANTVVASDTIGGVDYQRVKVVWGTTGTATELTTAAGLPVQITGQSSALNVAATLSSGTQVIGSVMPSSQWTVTTTPSSQATVSAVLTNPLGWLSSSTSTSATPIIGSVSPSSQWTVSVTPTSAISVTPSSQWTVTTTPSSQITVSAVLSNPLGWLSSSTSTATVPIIGAVNLTSGTQVIGSVAASSQWTVAITSSTEVLGATYTSYLSTDGISAVYVSTTNALPVSAQPFSVSSSTANVGSVSVSCSTLVVGSLIITSPIGWLSSSTSTATTPVIGSVNLTSGTQVIGSVAPSSTWTVALSSGTQVIGSVAPSSQWTVSAVTTAVRAVAADTGTLMSSGTVVTPLYHVVTSTTTGGLTVITTAVAAKVQIALAVHISNGSLSIPMTVSWRTGTSSSTLLAPASLPAGGNIILPYNPVGWFTSPSTEGFSLNITSTSSSTTVALPIGGCITYVAV